MSYDVSLVNAAGEQLHAPAPHQIAGGVYAEGGTTELWLNITYNYAPIFARVLGEGGLRLLNGRSAKETLPILVEVSKTLHGDRGTNYWACTEGNVKLAILQLIALAQIRPDGIWEIT